MIIILFVSCLIDLIDKIDNIERIINGLQNSINGLQNSFEREMLQMKTQLAYDTTY